MHHQVERDADGADRRGHGGAATQVTDTRSHGTTRSRKLGTRPDEQVAGQRYRHDGEDDAEQLERQVEPRLRRRVGPVHGRGLGRQATRSRGGADQPDQRVDPRAAQRERQDDHQLDHQEPAARHRCGVGWRGLGHGRGTCHPASVAPCPECLLSEPRQAGKLRLALGVLQPTLNFDWLSLRRRCLGDYPRDAGAPSSTRTGLDNPSPGEDQLAAKGA